jgi:uncharacterized membrane protein YeaQ/YmgE (transglycosylase-associated protein family)
VTEFLQDQYAYVLENPVMTFIIAFSCGFLATRLVASERRPGIIGASFVGILGFFLGNAMLSYYQLHEYMDTLSGLRYLIVMVTAFISSFVIAGILHFFKPN